MYILSFIAWILVVVGFITTYNSTPFLLATFGLVILFLTISLTLSSIINSRYKKFDLIQHNITVKEYWRNIASAPTIDILLPICGESLETVTNTWKGVFELKKRYGDKLKVYVLDDKGLKQYERTAKDFNFNYLSRPNKGETKKAGNLKYGFDQSNGEFIVIFDADFRPHRDFIYELLPYMDDPRIGIVQSPQYFEVTNAVHKRSMLEYGAGNIQEYFYRIIQRSRGGFGASICVGTNAIYRRTALQMIGGTAQVHHSEDVWTGFKLISKGWKLIYIPLILAKGICPDDLYAYFKQQNRWCLGSMSLMTSKEFWSSSVPFMTKIPFISGFAFYISNPLMLSLPFQNFLLLWSNQVTNKPYVTLLFLPSLITSTVILYTHIYRGAKAGTLLAYSASSWSYSYAIISSILRIPEQWVPTGEKNTFNRGFKLFTFIVTGYLLTYLVTLFLTIKNGRFVFGSLDYGLVSLWVIINLGMHSFFVLNLWKYILQKTKIPALRFITTNRIARI